MSAGGETANASVWAEGDVLIGAEDATIPENGEPFDMAEWAYVGFLSGEDGFTESIETESSNHFAWGGHLLATTRSNFFLTRNFTAYEDNETVYDLVYPGHDVDFSGGDGTFEGDINVPDLQAKFRVAFVTRTGDTIKRFISRNYAQVQERGDKQESETELARRQLTVAIYPGDPDSETGKRPLAYTYKGPATVPSG
jgi:hypothetical protein